MEFSSITYKSQFEIVLLGGTARMERAFALLTCMIVAFLGVGFAVAQDIAPDFTLTDIDGVEFSLSDYRNGIVLLNFISCPCRFCVAEIPHLRSLYEEFGEDLTIMSISDSDSVETLREFKQENNIDWIVSRDDIGYTESYDLPFPYHPTIILIDREGVIRYERVGFVDKFVLRSEVIKLLQEFPAVNDVAVSDVRPQRVVMPNNTSTSINVTVENQGNVGVAFNVILHCNLTQIGTQEVILDAGLSTVLTFHWAPTLVGTYTLWAEASQVPGEVNLTNNLFVFGNITAQAFLPADLNYDGIVNVLDFSIVAVAFGCTPEDLDWNEMADLNNDLIINILDISIAATEFGKTV